jgi:tricarballylate dehydrogenase
VDPGGRIELTAASVVLGCGGFEANSQWRAQYLGAPWDHAKVRGTAFNQGDGLRMALAAGALPWGQWSGRHSTPISNEWPDFADRKRTDKSNRLSYPFGVMEDRYKSSDPLTADTLAELVTQLDLDDHDQALRTLKAYNDTACDAEGFDPSRKDGLSTKGLSPEKTNWGVRLDSPPFVAYSATGGITFTFGGLKIDESARVIATDWRPIPGLYTCGEMVGGVFHINYPGGTGLVSGAVFGRIAGRSAARAANR